MVEDDVVPSLGDDEPLGNLFDEESLRNLGDEQSLRDLFDEEPLRYSPTDSLMTVTDGDMTFSSYIEVD